MSAQISEETKAKIATFVRLETAIKALQAAADQAKPLRPDVQDVIANAIVLSEGARELCREFPA